MRAASSKTTVLLVDDHDMVRTGLRLVLDAEEDLEVLAEARSGRQAVELVKKWRPDVVVMDFALPSMNGALATRRIVAELPGTAVLMLSMHAEETWVHQALERALAAIC